MRYLNWDVLLFPDQSRIPIQEFDVKCHALSIAETRPSYRSGHGPVSSKHATNMPIPTLTGFISSLQPNHPFRVSIHCWEQPTASEAVLRLKPLPDRIIFEARVFVDGHLQAQRYLADQNGWPAVIDTVITASVEPAKLLRFPPFHSEILQQTHWDARDGLGRIRVVIAKGVATSSSHSSGRVFDKVRDIVAFSFQHAPRSILEHSGIAWPNARMLQKPYTVTRPPSRAAGPDAHAHSPTKLPQTLHAKRNSMIDDPFLDSTATLSSRRTTNTDMTTVDAPSMRGSEMSDVAMSHVGFDQQVNRAAVAEMIQSLTPSKRDALLKALSPTGVRVAGTAPEATKPAVNHRIQSIKNFELPSDIRKSSAGSRSTSSKSTSAQSTAMSWDETPIRSDSWTGHSDHEYPGLLASMRSSIRDRSASVRSKRKRSSSPVSLAPSCGDSLANIKDVSASPCQRRAASAKKDNGRARKGSAVCNKDQRASVKEESKAA